MHVLRERRKTTDKVELPMTPMIDVVFQLLVFFIMTFRITSLEGDFNVKMPVAEPNAGLPDEDQPLPMRVRLRAAADGQIAQISLDENNFGVNFDSLRNYIIGVIGDERGPGSKQDTAEIELDCDFNLRYEHVIQTITAVTGYLDANGDMVKLVERVKFAQPRSGP